MFSFLKACLTMALVALTGCSSNSSPNTTDTADVSDMAVADSSPLDSRTTPADIHDDEVTDPLGEITDITADETGPPHDAQEVLADVIPEVVDAVDALSETVDVMVGDGLGSETDSVKPVDLPNDLQDDFADGLDTLEDVADISFDLSDVADALNQDLVEDIGPLNPCEGKGYGQYETVCQDAEVLLTCLYGQVTELVDCGELTLWWWHEGACEDGVCVSFPDPYYQSLCDIIGFDDEGEPVEDAICFDGEFILCEGDEVLDVDVCGTFQDPCAGPTDCMVGYPNENVPLVCLEFYCVDYECESSGWLEGCCWYNQQCFDQDPCTSEKCLDNKCVVTVYPECCHFNLECDDGDPCTEEHCNKGVCSFEPVPGC